MEAVEQCADGVRLHVRVQPKASRNAVSKAADGSIRVAITAPPVDGAANKAVCAFLAKALGVSRSRVTVVSGGKSRDKTLHVAGVDRGAAMKRLGLA